MAKETRVRPTMGGRTQPGSVLKSDEGLSLVIRDAVYSKSIHLLGVESMTPYVFVSFWEGGLTMGCE